MGKQWVMGNQVLGCAVGCAADVMDSKPQDIARFGAEGGPEWRCGGLRSEVHAAADWQGAPKMGLPCSKALKDIYILQPNQVSQVWGTQCNEQYRNTCWGGGPRPES
eukprot:268727-Pelagomonas_calceolata.AAC.1